MKAYFIFTSIFMILTASASGQKAGLKNGRIENIFTGKIRLTAEKNTLPAGVVELEDPDGKITVINSTRKQAGDYHIAENLQNSGALYTVTRNGKKVLQFELKTRVGKDAAGFKCSIPFIAAKYRIAKLKYPCFALAKIGKTDNLLVPISYGQVFADPHHKKEVRSGKGSAKVKAVYYGRYPSKTCNLQMVYYYPDNGSGILFMVPDPTRCVKEFIYDRNSNKQLCFSMVNYPSDPQPERDRKLDFPYILKTVEINGSWYDAAQVYRRWALKQSWAGEPLNKKPTTPEWFASLSQFVRIPRDPGVAKKVKNEYPIKWRKRTGASVAVHWYGWDVENCPGNTTFMAWRKPSQETVEYIKKYHKLGIKVFPFINARVVAFVDPMWDKYKDATVRDRDNDFEGLESWKNYVSKEEYKKGIAEGRRGVKRRKTQSLYYKFAVGCFATPEWQKRVVNNVISSIKDYNFDGVYQDQIISFAMICFAKNHGHVPGSPDAWLNGFRKAYGEIRKWLKEHNKKAAIISEYLGEWNIPWLDGGLTISGYTCVGHRPLPLFPAVYHERQAGIGWPTSSKDLNDNLQNYCFSLMMPFIYGSKMGWLSYGVDRLSRKKYAAITDCYAQGAQLRDKYPQMLGYGKMLRPPVVSGVEILKAPTENPKQAIYAHPFPAVLSSVFAAENLKSALAVMCNWTPQERSGKITLDLSELKGVSKIRFVDGGQEIKVKGNSVSIPFKIAPYSVRALLIN